MLFRIFLFLLLATLCPGCLYNNSEPLNVNPESLTDAKQLWHAINLHDYSVEIEQYCFCGGPQHYR